MFVCDFIIFWFVVRLNFHLIGLHTAYFFHIIRLKGSLYFVSSYLQSIFHDIDSKNMLFVAIWQWTLQKIFTPFATCLDIWTLWCLLWFNLIFSIAISLSLSLLFNPFLWLFICDAPDKICIQYGWWWWKDVYAFRR